MRKLSISLFLATALVSQIALADAHLAIVNGVSIPKSRMEHILKGINQNGRGLHLDEKMAERLKENIITNEVIRQEAVKKGINKDPLFLAQVEQMQEQLLIRTFIDDFVKTHPITEAAAKKEYHKIKANQGNKEYLVRHILVKDEAIAKELITQLKKGVKFNVLAKPKSTDSGSAKQGGELGWAVPENYTQPFAEAIIKMPKGKISDTPVKTEFGWHIIKVEDIRKSKGPAFSEVKEEIIRQMQSEALKKHVAMLVLKAEIVQ